MTFKKRLNKYSGLALLLILMLTPSCQMFKPIELTRVVDFKVAESKGFGFALKATLELLNPNRGAIRITNADIDVYVEGQYLGKLTLPETFILPPGNPEIVSCHMDISLTTLITSGKNVLKKIKSGSFNVQLKGTLDAHYRLLKKHIDINTTHLVEL